MPRLCPSCGAVLMDGIHTCPRCNVSKTSSEPKAFGRWVRVEVQLRCRVCGLLSPITPMHASEVARCDRCEREQAFDPAVWPRVMEEARKALTSAGAVQGEVVTPDDLPRKVGMALLVNSVVDEPPQQAGGAKQYIPSEGGGYRGGARLGWFRLAEEAAKDGIAVDPKVAEDEEEAARDRFGFWLNSSLVVAECALLIGAVWLWKGLGKVDGTFWGALGGGAFLNGIWGWASLSLAQRPKETDVWVYYLIGLLPQLVWIGAVLVIAS